MKLPRPYKRPRGYPLKRQRNCSQTIKRFRMAFERHASPSHSKAVGYWCFLTRGSVTDDWMESPILTIHRVRAEPVMRSRAAELTRTTSEWGRDGLARNVSRLPDVVKTQSRRLWRRLWVLTTRQCRVFSRASCLLHLFCEWQLDILSPRASLDWRRLTAPCLSRWERIRQSPHASHLKASF